MNQFNLGYIWDQGDVITRGVALILLLMSIMSWTVILLKIVQQMSLKVAVVASKHRFWQKETLAQGAQLLGKQRFNPFRELIITGHAVSNHQIKYHIGLSRNLDLSEWMVRCLKNVLDDSASRLQNGMGILASIGATAPFVGLLGTVWGIYHALQTISQLQQPDIAHVAGPVGEALTMTAFGLFVAIPAVLGFNALGRRNKIINHALNRFAHDLHSFYLTGSRVTANVADIQSVKNDTKLRNHEQSA